MSQLKLFLFGTPRLQRDNQPLNLKRRKALALLTYLAVTGRAQSREALATLLWPEQDLSTGLTNLRSELYRLRKLLDNEVLEIERSQIGLTQPLQLWLDVAHFRERLAAAQQHDHPADELCEICTVALAEAVDIYTEDFMAGFNLPDSPGFDEWQFFQAESLRQELAQTLQQLMAWYSQQQAYESAIAYARRWLALDELHEPAHRQLMALYAQAGQQSAALRQYEICQRLLAEELGIVPEPATQELAEAIKLRRFPGESDRTVETTIPSLSTVLAAPYRPPFLDEEALVTTTPPVFVTRENELAALATALETAHTGQGQLLFVIGGAGRGKTMLVQEFARRAQADDPELIVVRGSCKAQIGIGDPYLPFREALDMLMGDVEALWAGGLVSTSHARRLWTLMPVAVAHLVDYGPDLIDSFVPGQALLERAAAAMANSAWLASLETLVNAPERRQIQQKHIFAQMTALLKAIAGQQPLLLILEDLHWADTASISLLFHLSREVSDGRILIAGTYRPDEVSLGWADEQHPLAKITGELKRRHGDIWLDLGEVAAFEGRRFVEGYLDVQPNQLDDTFRQALFDHTGGHALFTVELLRDMQERGDLRLDEQGRWIAGETIDWQALPAKVEGVIEHRMHRLNNEAKSILTIASVEGETFTAEVVARVQGLDERLLVRRLSQELDKQHRLVTAQALERLGRQRLSIYRFRHNLFQKYLYQSLDEAQRAYYHEDVGNVLRELYGEQKEQVAVQLAWHFQEAGLTEQAVDYLGLAGRQAVHLSAFEEAMTHLARALTLLETVAVSPERDRQELDLLTRLGPALIATRGYASPEVERTYSRARQLCREAEDAPKLFSALRGLSVHHRVRGALQTARKFDEELLSLAQHVEDPARLVEAHFSLGATLTHFGELGQALNHLEQCYALYDSRQHHELAFLYGQDPGVASLSRAAVVLWLLGYPDQSLERVQQAQQLAQQLAHPFSQAFALSFSALVHMLRREGQPTLEQSEAAGRLAAEHRLPYRSALGAIYRGWALTQQGKLEEGIVQMREGLTAEHTTHAQLADPQFLALLAEAYGATGQTAEGLAVLAEALTVAHNNDDVYYEAELHRLKGELLLKAEGGRWKDEAETEECFRQAIEVARQQEAKSLELRATVSLARLWLSQGKREEARQMLAEIYGWFTEGFDTVDLQEAKALLEELS